MRRSQRVPRAAELVENCAWVGFEVFAQDLPARDIDQVPVVDAARIAEIETHNLPALLLVRAPVLGNKNFERRAAMLMESRFEQLLDVGEWQSPVLERDFSQHRNRYSEKDVSFAVLAFAGFEVAGPEGCPLGIPGSFQGALKMGACELAFASRFHS